MGGDICYDCQKPLGTPPNWVLRTAIGPASLAGYLAVRSTRAQHRCAALVRHPGQGPDLAELAPCLAPGVAGILAREHLPVVTARQHQVRIGSVHGEGPDGRV